MAADNSVTDPFLAAIEAKIAAWTAVRDSYLAAVSVDGAASEAIAVSGAGTATGSSRAHAQGLPVGVFRDKSLKEAIPIYLAAMRQKQTNKQIAQGLQAGGFPTTADNFEATVATALYRLRTDGVLLRFPDGWDLASSYPEGLRSRLDKDATPKKKLRAKVAKRQPRAENSSQKVFKIRRSKPLLDAATTDTTDGREAV
jgi:hypothetical protein